MLLTIKKFSLIQMIIYWLFLIWFMFLQARDMYHELSIVHNFSIHILALKCNVLLQIIKIIYL